MAFFEEVDSFHGVSSLGKIFLYALLALLGGALAAPVAWHLIHHLPASLFHGLIGDVQRMPFHRYLSRSFQVAAILLLWPLVRVLNIRSMEEFGLSRSHRKGIDFMIGLAAGIPSALLLVGLTIFSGIFELHSEWSPSTIPKILLSAAVVALMEEFLFRGLLLGYLRQTLSNGLAIASASVGFAVLHFLNLPSGAAGEAAPSWWSGLSAMGALWSTLPSWPILGWAFASLFLAGIILGWMTVRTGSLAASIGLHGSWIFIQQMFHQVAGFHSVVPDSFLPYIGPPQCHGAVPIGIFPLFSLIVAGVLAMIFLRNRPEPRRFNR